VLSYDANGSTVREELGDPAFQVTEYGYDPQDRLIEVKRDGVTQVEYAYDPFGQRVWRETKPASLEGATVTWFLYSREGLIGEYRADGSAIREYGWLPNGLWGTDPVWQHDATGTHVMHNDHLFTPERMTHAGEHVVSWAGTREAFGRVAVQPGSSTTMLLRFPGQWEDGVGGFYQNWWREYGAEVGAYSQIDKIALAYVPNNYTYVQQAPLRLFDPRGLHIVRRPHSESGSTIYCDRNRVMQIRVSDSSKCPGMKKCAEEHELIHIQQVKNRYGDDICEKLVVDGQPTGFAELDRRVRMRDEAEAHEAECGCLQRFLLDKPCKVCKAEYEERICEINSVIKKQIENGTYPSMNTIPFSPNCSSGCEKINAH
jgi:RHS repeat-associated protein